MVEGDRRTWTVEEDALLRKLHALGRSMQQIGTELGRTRNAVIGRATRLGLKSPPPRLRVRTAAQKAAAAKVAEKFRAANPKAKKKLSPIELARLRTVADRITRPDEWRTQISEDRTGEPPSKQLSLVKLETTQCRYHSSMPDPTLSGFCGHDTKERSAYCEYHHRKCYTPIDNASNLRVSK